MNARAVLLIDHDQDWCARICRMLEPHGISVVSATDMTAARERLVEMGRPDAVVMDVTKRRGGAHAAELRSDNAMRDVPTGYINKTAALDALLLMLTPSAAGAHTHFAA
jgi:CheY-like chemotaxis protein